MRCEDGVYQGRFPQPGLTCNNSQAQTLRHGLCSPAIPTQITLNWKPRLSSLRSIWVVMLSKPTWLLGITGPCWGAIAVAMIDWGGSKREFAYEEEEVQGVPK